MDELQPEVKEILRAIQENNKKRYAAQSAMEDAQQWFNKLQAEWYDLQDKLIELQKPEVAMARQQGD